MAATFFMVSGGPYGIEDIIGGAGYKWAFVLLLCLPFLWSLPTALMIGELASALPAEGGFYVWVRRALGPFWGFQEAWLSLAASIFDMAIYPTLFTLYLGRLAPSLTAGHRTVWWSLAVLAACLLWNLFGAASVGSGSVWLMCLLLAPFAVLVIAGMRHGASGGEPSATHELDFATAFLVALWNYMGWDNASTVAAEVEQPQHNYPRAMMGAAALVAICYLVPTLAARIGWRAGGGLLHWFVGRRSAHAGGSLARACYCCRRHDQWLRHVQRADALLHAAAGGAGAGRVPASRGCSPQSNWRAMGCDHALRCRMGAHRQLDV